MIALFFDAVLVKLSPIKKGQPTPLKIWNATISYKTYNEVIFIKRKYIHIKIRHFGDDAEKKTFQCTVLQTIELIFAFGIISGRKGSERIFILFAPLSSARV